MTGSRHAWRCDHAYGRVTASRCDDASELINAARLDAGAVAESVAAVGDDVPEEVDDTDRGNGGSS